MFGPGERVHLFVRFYLLLYQIDRESGKCPARGISEGSRENPGMDDYSIIRESPARMSILV